MLISTYLFLNKMKINNRGGRDSKSRPRFLSKEPFDKNVIFSVHKFKHIISTWTLAEN